jgi:hypothetical protein
LTGIVHGKSSIGRMRSKQKYAIKSDLTTIFYSDINLIEINHGSFHLQAFMVMVINLWNKRLPTSPETSLIRCCQLHGTGRDANTCNQKQQWYESKGLLKCAFAFQEAL